MRPGPGPKPGPRCLRGPIPVNVHYRNYDVTLVLEAVTN